MAERELPGSISKIFSQMTAEKKAAQTAQDLEEQKQRDQNSLRDRARAHIDQYGEKTAGLDSRYGREDLKPLGLATQFIPGTITMEDGGKVEAEVRLSDDIQLVGEDQAQVIGWLTQVGLIGAEEALTLFKMSRCNYRIKNRKDEDVSVVEIRQLDEIIGFLEENQEAVK